MVSASCLQWLVAMGLWAAYQRLDQAVPSVLGDHFAACSLEI